MEFALGGLFVKIFDARYKDIVFDCMEMFNVQSPYHGIIKRRCKFLHNIMSSANLLCQFVKISLKRNFVVILVQIVRNNYCFVFFNFLFNLIYCV